MVEDAWELETIAKLGLEVSGLVFEMTGVVTVSWKCLGLMGPHLSQSSPETGP